MYKRGDFSFCSKYQKVFEYDYKIIDKMGDLAWNKLKNPDQINYITEIINQQLYPGHTALTYRLSMKYLNCIAVHGWDYFVRNFKES